MFLPGIAIQLSGEHQTTGQSVSTAGVWDMLLATVNAAGSSFLVTTSPLTASTLRPAALHLETNSNQMTPPPLRRPDSTARPHRTDVSLARRSLGDHHLRPRPTATRRKTNECSSRR